MGENWALVGWELHRAETPADIRSALELIKGINCRHLDAFRREPTTATTARGLRKLRKQSAELSLQRRKAHYSWVKCKESAERARTAIRSAQGPQASEELRTIGAGLDADLEVARATLHELEIRSGAIASDIEHREAWFAQSELLRFIGSDRYASTPLNFANAMAGLPVITWRQSMERCNRFQDGASLGWNYRQFLIVADVAKHLAANPEEAIEQMKACLRQAKGADVEPCNPLAKNWYFLRCAMESVFKAEHPPKEALPYRIFAEYQRRLAHRSQTDTVLAEREVITTPAFVKERRRLCTPGQGGA
jgi:hypothetical protein